MRINFGEKKPALTPSVQSGEPDDKSCLPQVVEAAAAQGHLPQQDDGKPQIIGPYEVLDEIGLGGMGVVHRVRHRGAGTVLAMKILRAELAADPVNVQRFQQELKTTSLLTHPNIVPIYDSGLTVDGAPYMVMEYLDGRNLETILHDEGYIDTDRFLQLFKQVLDALSLAHEKRIVHRDLKPSNIVVCTSDAGCELVKILDFGIARVLQKATREATRFTQIGEIVGSPSYMSPEQCRNHKLDARSDIYSLGVVMYQCLAGVTPFSGGSAVEIIMQQLQARPRSISKLRPDFNIPQDLESMIMTCLEKDPKARFQTIDELRHELDRISGAIKSNGLVSAWKRLNRRLRYRLRQSLRSLVQNRRRWVKGVGAATACALALTYGYNTYCPQPKVSDYVDRADMALISGMDDQVEQTWRSAINFAKQRNLPALEMGNLYERAGDAILSTPSKQINFQTVGDTELTLVFPIKESREAVSNDCVKVAERLYQEALRLYDKAHQADCLRVLEKLVAAAKKLNEVDAEAAYLTERLSFSSAQAESAYMELAQIREDQGRYPEAEALTKKAIQAEKLDPERNGWNQTPTLLKSFYRRLGRYKSEEGVIRDNLAELRIQNIANPQQYKEPLAQELEELAICLREQGRGEEAISYALEAGKLRKEKV